MESHGKTMSDDQLEQEIVKNKVADHNIVIYLIW